MPPVKRDMKWGIAPSFCRAARTRTFPVRNDSQKHHTEQRKVSPYEKADSKEKKKKKNNPTMYFSYKVGGIKVFYRFACLLTEEDSIECHLVFYNP